MRRVSRELPLRLKCAVEALQHTVKGKAELTELRQAVVGNLHIAEIVKLNLFNLRGKTAQGLQRVPADKICQNAA